MAVLVHPQNAQEEKVLKAFLDSLQYQYESSGPQNIQEYNTELNEAVIRVKKGHFTTQEELEKEMLSW